MGTTLLTLPTETWLKHTDLIPGTANLLFKKDGIVSMELQEQDCQLNFHEQEVSHIQYGWMLRTKDCHTKEKA